MGSADPRRHDPRPRARSPGRRHSRQHLRRSRSSGGPLGRVARRRSRGAVHRALRARICRGFVAGPAELRSLCGDVHPRARARARRERRTRSEPRQPDALPRPPVSRRSLDRPRPDQPRALCRARSRGARLPAGPDRLTPHLVTSRRLRTVPASPRRTYLVALVALAALLAMQRSAAATRVTFRTDDGVMLAGTWYEPSSRPAAAVIFVHMLHRSRRDWEAIAQRFAAEGIGALAIDLRGHGESPGGVAAADGGQADYSSLVLDVKAARRHLSQRGDIQQ